ncbi:MAG: cold shock domain-containing protein, partial [Holosporaceae bacterium]|nr:cold shock domain-containing protein [Holosporaceae bacterium]
MFTDDKNQQCLNVTGKIKWFNQFKGYGFVEVENMPEDVFLHFSVIDQSGIDKLNNEDVIICNIEKTDRGFQVTNVLDV